MKKLSMLVLSLVLLGASWQTAYSNGRLVVHETTDPNSAVCYDGAGEDYDGHCVNPAAPSWAYYYKKLMESVRGSS